MVISPYWLVFSQLHQRRRGSCTRESGWGLLLQYRVQEQASQCKHSGVEFDQMPLRYVF